MDKTTFVYMVRCADGSYYVGSHRGEDPAARVSGHNMGVDRKAYTYRRRPVTLVWAEAFPDALTAIGIERQIKGWSRAKKEALIRRDWAEVSRLARSSTPRPPSNPLLRPPE